LKSSRSDFKYILIQGLITLLIAFIPIYFYIDASIKNQDIKDKLDLQSYSNQVVKKIENFLEQNGEVFYFPRSNIFYSSLYDENKKEKFFTNLSLDFFEDDFNENAKVAVDITVNQSGAVIAASINPKGTTTTNTSIRNIAIQKAKTLKLNAADASEQTGTLIFDFKLRN